LLFLVLFVSLALIGFGIDANNYLPIIVGVIGIIYIVFNLLVKLKDTIIENLEHIKSVLKNIGIVILIILFFGFFSVLLVGILSFSVGELFLSYFAWLCIFIPLSTHLVPKTPKKPQPHQFPDERDDSPTAWSTREGLWDGYKYEKYDYKTNATKKYIYSGLIASSIVVGVVVLWRLLQF